MTKHGIANIKVRNNRLLSCMQAQHEQRMNYYKSSKPPKIPLPKPRIHNSENVRSSAEIFVTCSCHHKAIK